MNHLIHGIFKIFKNRLRCKVLLVSGLKVKKKSITTLKSFIVKTQDINELILE